MDAQKDLKTKTVEELEVLLLEVSKELFNLRMQMGSAQLKQNHLIRNARKNIARIKTVLTEKKTLGE